MILHLGQVVDSVDVSPINGLGDANGRVFQERASPGVGGLYVAWLIAGVSLGEVVSPNLGAEER